ncbi:MAG: PEP-CTERM sorting domain-containing protein [Proteobacteria bacterium]|nr:PEP-CTERM sorting domain-containing protein [Pseudomonadota bacterium]
MRASFQIIAITATLIYGSVGSIANATPITWFAPTQPGNSNVNFPAGTLYSNNMGVAFKTGPGSSYSLDWVKLGLNTSTVSGGPSATVKLALHNTTNDIAYSAVAGSTVYAVDTLSFTLPTTTATSFDLNLDASQMPNVSNYVMSGNTAYSLILYNPSVTLGLTRRTGYANGTTNAAYTVGDGFTALDTFRNNAANYTNTANSYPTLSISFGKTQSVPEPPSLALVASAIAAWWLVARRRGRTKSV